MSPRCFSTCSKAPFLLPDETVRNPENFCTRTLYSYNVHLPSSFSRWSIIPPELLPRGSAGFLCMSYYTTNLFSPISYVFPVSSSVSTKSMQIVIAKRSHVSPMALVAYSATSHPDHQQAQCVGEGGKGKLMERNPRATLNQGRCDAIL